MEDRKVDRRISDLEAEVLRMARKLSVIDDGFSIKNRRDIYRAHNLDGTISEHGETLSEHSDDINDLTAFMQTAIQVGLEANLPALDFIYMITQIMYGVSGDIPAPTV